MTKKLDLQGAARFLESRLDQYLDDLAALVNVDSGTFDKSGVDQVAGLLRNAYRAIGADIADYPYEQYGDMFSATWQGVGKGRVLLIGHTDTVYPLGTVAARPFTIDGDRALGPGVADMKSGDLSIVYAMTALLDQGWDDFETITVLHNSEEEIGSPASKEWIRREALRSDVVLVLEAGRENGDIVSARKGILYFEVEVGGRSAHAGVNHAAGRSAALELAHLIVALESLNNTIPGVTLNVGRVRSGDRSNVVPDQGDIIFEVRGPDQGSLDQAVAEVERIVAKRTEPETTATLKTTVEHAPMHKSKAIAHLVERAQALSGELGFSVRDVATGGASDGNTAAAAGRPVLDGLGPVGGGSHSRGEWLSIPSIVPRTALLAGLIAEFGGTPPQSEKTRVVESLALDGASRGSSVGRATD